MYPKQGLMDDNQTYVIVAVVMFKLYVLKREKNYALSMDATVLKIKVLNERNKSISIYEYNVCVL